MSPSFAIPSTNEAAFKLMYAIEVGLREFIIDSIEKHLGPSSWKSRLPPDVLATFHQGKTYERRIAWCDLIPHHPLYYVEFPDLKKIIAKRDNWRDFFQPTFGEKDVLSGLLRSLEPIRNKIAHSRKATGKDVTALQDAFDKINSAVGAERFCALVAQCTCAEDIPESLMRLRVEAQLGIERTCSCQQLEGLEIWNSVCAQWWFDSDYLGHSVDPISMCFETLTAYRALPRYRGCGHKIESWVKAENVEGKYASAIEVLAKLLEAVKGA